MKKIFLSIFAIITVFIGINQVFAGSLSINGSDSVYVGSTVTVTVNFNNIAGRFRIESSNSSVLSGNYEDFYDNQSVKLLFTANSQGTATISVTPVGAVGDYDSDSYTGGGRSLTINVIKKNTPTNIEINKTYSKNNYLSNLSVEGYELTPGFNKETLEYKIELEPGTETISIKASQEDNKATVRGIGDISVSEGINTISVTVIAENGNERTYTIIASVDEKDPIIVKLNGKEYRVIKKEELIEERTGYNKVKIKINDFEIPSLYNDVTKVNLIALKDSEGNIIYASYNTKTGDYSLYKEFNFDVMNLYIHENKKSKYEKVNIKINDLDTLAYKIEGLTDYYLLYATNTSTGYEGYYLYDVKENSVQRYNTFMLDKLTKEKDKYLSLVLVLSSVCFLAMLFLLIQVNRENKRETN